MSTPVELQSLTQRATPECAAERIYAMLTRAYSFLYQTASENANWSEARSTALAAICLQFVEDRSSPWLPAVNDWIRNSQLTAGSAAGSWGEEIWDSAMCILALKSCAVSSKDPSIQSCLQWIDGLYSKNGRNNWHDEPWETSWALLAILTAGLRPQQADIVASVRWLSAFQDQSGNIIAPHYSAYFLMIMHGLRKFAIGEEDERFLNKVNKEAGKYLLSALRESPSDRLWTGEAWSNGQVLWAVASTGIFPVNDEELCHKTLSWFEDQQTNSGNWSDVEDTASAILGLIHLLALILNRQAEHLPLGDVLRKRITKPQLTLKRRFCEVQPDGSLRLNVTRRMISVLSGSVLILTVLGTLTTLFEFARAHHWLR